MTVLRLALWQGAGVAGDLSATLSELARVAGLAAGRGAGLLVFPEGYLTGYFLPDLVPGGLQGVEEALSEIGRIAQRAGLALVMGSHLAAAGCVRNAAVVFSAGGDEVGRYFKRALFGGWERRTFRPGTAPLRFDCGGLRVGLAICYDVEFPELIRAEAVAKVDLVVVPTALMAPHDRIARLVVPTRALENQIALGYANRTGREGAYDFVGLSSIRGPRGEALAEAGADPALLVADIDRALLRRERAAGGYLDDLAALRGRGGPPLKPR